MTEYDVKRLALVLSVQAEIEAMKIENLIRFDNNESPAYDGGSFQELSRSLLDLAYKHDHQL